MARLLLLLSGALAALALAAPSGAEPTRVDVRVLSRGAKFVGSSMGGAEVTLRDAYTGELLARGVTRGGTGDTGRIMRDERGRHAPVATDSAAVFRATLDLDEPRRVEASARGPLAQPQAAASVSSTMWLVPGRHVTGGDGWLLELPGFVVDVLAPAAHRTLPGAPREVSLRANVTMMCGCPVEPGGLWDAEGFEIEALVRRDGGAPTRVPLAFAGTTSLFEATLAAPEPGLYEVVVYAFDPANGNTGVDRTTFMVAPAR